MGLYLRARCTASDISFFEDPCEIPSTRLREASNCNRLSICRTWWLVWLRRFSTVIYTFDFCFIFSAVKDLIFCAAQPLTSHVALVLGVRSSACQNSTEGQEGHGTAMQQLHTPWYGYFGSGTLRTTKIGRFFKRPWPPTHPIRQTVNIFRIWRMWQVCCVILQHNFQSCVNLRKISQSVRKTNLNESVILT